MATSDLPEPVGVARTTFAPLTSSISASSCAGYSTVPLASAHAAKEANSSSGSAPFARRADRSLGSSSRAGAMAGRDIVRTSLPDGSPATAAGASPVLPAVRDAHPNYDRQVSVDLPRPVNREESELLEAFLGHDFSGVEALRGQTRGLLAKRGCKCGCGTIDLLPQGPDLPRSSARNPVEVSGQVRDPDGTFVGGVVLWLEDGLLSSLEVYWYDSPIALPAVRSVEWRP